MSKFNSRLAEIMHENGVNAADLSKNLGVAESTISNWKKSEKPPKGSAISSLASYFGVNPVWLGTGQAPKYEVDNDNSEDFDIKKIANLVINNTNELLKDTNFKNWYENIQLKAKIEAMKEFKQTLE